jgi:hypothetical protein
MQHVIEFSRRLNDADAKFFFIGERRGCNVAMVTVMVLGGDVSLRELVEEFVPGEGGVPRFADYLRRAPLGLAPPVWMPLPADERVIEYYGRETSLPAGAGWEAVFDAVDALQSAPFHPDRAPWQVELIRGAPDGRTVLVMKVHHAISDGHAFAMLFAKTFAGDVLAAANASIEVEVEPPPRGPRLWIALQDRAVVLRRWLGCLADSLPELTKRERRRRELEAMRKMLRPPRRWPLRSHGRERQLSGFRVPVAAWQAEAERREGGSNELFLAIAARITRLSLDGSDLDADPLRVGMPISLRSGSVHDGGNATAFAVLELAGTEAELADLSLVRSRAAEARKKAVAAAAPTLFEATLELLPGRLRAAIEFRQGAACDVLATNIPIPVEGKVLGVPVEDALMVAPAIGQAVSFSLTTYRGHFHLAVNADLGIVSASPSERAEAVLEEMFGSRLERFGAGPQKQKPQPEEGPKAVTNGAIRWNQILNNVNKAE